MDWKERISTWLVRKLGHLFISTLLHTCRLRVHGAPPQTDQPRIFIFWHRYILYTMFHFRHVAARPLISLSKDGEMISAIAQEFGMNPIRGSSSRGGARAFLELLKLAQSPGGDLLITADGPKGPLRVVKPGVVKLAQKTTAPLIPVCWKASRCWILKKSWDQFIIPKPFCRLEFHFGPIIDIGQATNEADVAEKIKALENFAKNH